MLPNTYKWRKSTEHTGVNLIEKILNNRGIYGKDHIEAFLNPTKAALHSPYLLNDMRKAVKRIAEAKLKNKPIVIYGDYDVDGITSTSILYMFLKSCNYDVSYYIPDRQTEGYGLNKEAIAKIQEYADLIITVDTGIAAVMELDFANSIGLDIIITDHHECQEQLPKGYCIINPKRKDSTYPFDSLAGVGVTFKLIHALAIEENREDEIWEYIDLVALGTIADVVPLIHENRAITYLGFEAMQKTRHIGLKELINLVSAGAEKVTSNMIAYQVGPRINAAGRLGDAKIGVELLTTKDELRAKQLAGLLDEENKKRQEMEADIIKQAEEYIEKHIDLKREKVLIVVGKEWHHGVIGIVASRIMAKYYRPTIVLTEEESVLSGSARSIEGFNLFEAINLTKEYLLRFGGHEMAAGLSLKIENLEMFRSKINQYADKQIDEDMLIPSMTIDSDMGMQDVDLAFCTEIERLEPFGAHNPVPLFSIKGKVQYVQKMGQNDKHLKLTLEQDNRTIQVVGFYKGYLADYLSAGEEIVLGCEIIKNTWRNKASVQLRIKDIQSTNEVILKSKYYISLYHYLKEPNIVDTSDLHFTEESPNLLDAKVIYVYTEAGLNNVCKIIKNNPKNSNLNINICYNKDCSNGEEIFICVNPIEKLYQGTSYEWDYKIIDEKITTYCQDLTHHKKQLTKMIPSHKDCIAVYKLLKNNTLDCIYIHKAIVGLSAYDMTEYKLFQILDIFKELTILECTIAEDKMAYQLIDSGKTRLDRSAKYRTMQQFSESMQQID